MKIVRLIALLGLLFSFAMQLNAQHRVEVTIEGVGEEDIYFGFYYGRIKSYVDTVRLVNGKAVFEGEKNLVKGLYFVQTTRGGFEMLVADQNFNVSVTAPDFINSFESSSEQCKGFNSLQREIMKNQQIYGELGRKLQAARGNQEESEAIRNQMEQLNTAINNFQLAVAQKYEGTFLGKMVNMMTRPALPEDAPKDADGFVLGNYQRRFYVDHFFDNIDFEEPSLLMTPIYHARLDEYIDQMTMRHPDSAIVAADKLLEKSSVSRPYYRYTLTALTGKFESLRQPWGNIVFNYLAKEYFLAGKADWMDDKLKFMLNAKVTTAPPVNKIGDTAPAIKGKDEEGKDVGLQSLAGDYNVIYFYDPDCSHCKKQTPILKSIYDELKGQGISVMAVNIGSDESRWKEYIQEKSLDWINAMGGEYSGNLIQDYHIMSTPTIYVLDKDKKIISNYLKVPEVRPYLNEKIGG